MIVALTARNMNNVGLGQVLFSSPSSIKSFGSIPRGTSEALNSERGRLAGPVNRTTGSLSFGVSWVVIGPKYTKVGYLSNDPRALIP